MIVSKSENDKICLRNKNEIAKYEGNLRIRDEEEAKKGSENLEKLKEKNISNELNDFKINQEEKLAKEKSAERLKGKKLKQRF